MREKKSHSRKCIIATKRLSCHSLLTSSGFCAIFIIRTANECLNVNLRREERRKPWKGGEKRIRRTEAAETSKQVILDTAEAGFAEKGYNAASLQENSDRAHVTRG